jgi:hypothetical protein
MQSESREPPSAACSLSPTSSVAAELRQAFAGAAYSALSSSVISDTDSFASPNSIDVFSA